jgi:eukaryotic-like serine/threonine-protein kinase
MADGGKIGATTGSGPPATAPRPSGSMPAVPRPTEPSGVQSSGAHGSEAPSGSHPSQPPGGKRTSQAPSGSRPSLASGGSRPSQAPASAQNVDPLVGRLINGRFQITGLIARGGMGRVYRAEQAPLGRVCALKVLTTTYEGEHDPEFHKRFFLEASIAAKITHPNSVTIFDYGQTEDDVYYMAMEYLEGVTLHRAIRQAGFFPEARVAHIARQVCRALREAHALGCIHRDLKPANVFLTEHGDEPDFVKVLDFGLVKNVLGEGKGEEQLTQTGLFMGSPKYMAPEQIRGEKVDARTDVYSLGIIMYEMLTGKVPFERQTSLNTLMAQVNDAPPPLREANPEVDASAEMEDLVLSCMAKDPDGRLGSMDEVLAVLKRFTGPGWGLTGEYRALGAASSSGPFRSADATPGPSRRSVIPGQLSAPKSLQTPPADFVATVTADTAQVASSSSPSVTMQTPGFPSMTPMIDGGGGGAISVAPGTLPTPDFRPRRGRTLGIVLVAVSVLTIGAIIVSRLLPSSSDVASTSSSASAPPVVAAPPPVVTPAVTTPPPPVVTTLSVRFVSDPPGASVKEDGQELCAATPCEHAFAADMSAEHKVTIAKNGFRADTRTVKASDAEVRVTLAVAKAWTPPPRTGGGGGGGGAKPAESSAAPSGFKDIPY